MGSTWLIDTPTNNEGILDERSFEGFLRKLFAVCSRVSEVCVLIGISDDRRILSWLQDLDLVKLSYLGRSRSWASHLRVIEQELKSRAGRACLFTTLSPSPRCAESLPYMVLKNPPSTGLVSSLCPRSSAIAVQIGPGATSGNSLASFTNVWPSSVSASN